MPESLALSLQPWMNNLPISQTFKPVQSDEQIVPIINALVNDVEGLYQVNIPNHGQIIKGFPEDLVIECQGVVNGSGVHGVSAPALPAKADGWSDDSPVA